MHKSSPGMPNCSEIIDQVVRLLMAGTISEETSKMDSKQSPQRFTHQEEAILLELKETNLSNREIAEAINTQFGTHHTSKSIEQRWQRSSNPILKKGNWDYKEDEELLYVFRKCEGDIEEVIAMFPERSRYQIEQRLRRLFIF